MKCSVLNVLAVLAFVAVVRAQYEYSGQQGLPQPQAYQQVPGAGSTVLAGASSANNPNNRIFGLLGGGSRPGGGLLSNLLSTFTGGNRPSSGYPTPYPVPAYPVYPAYPPQYGGGFPGFGGSYPGHGTGFGAGIGGYGGGFYG